MPTTTYLCKILIANILQYLIVCSDTFTKFYHYFCIVRIHFGSNNCRNIERKQTFMKLKLNIAKLRGTIFTQQINYSPEFVKNLSEVLEGFLPSFLTILPQNNSGGNSVIPNIWELINPNTGERIQFSNIKIDIILTCDKPYDSITISDFAKHCSDIFCKILSVTRHVSSRLAIAPTFSCTDTEDVIKIFAQTIYKKGEFKDSPIDNCVFNNIFRANEDINGQIILINYLANFYSTNRFELVDGKDIIRETLAIDFDINTFANDQYVFDTSATSSFFEKSTQMCSDFLGFFFE